MGPDVEVRLLGGAAVVRDGLVVPSRSRNLRTLLALLALRPGSGTTGTALAAELWFDQEEPRNPAAALQVQVTRLRTWLDPAGERTRYVRSDDGTYTLHIDPDLVDLARFGVLGDRALRAGTGAATALGLAEQALALWRGEPFAGCGEGPRLVAARVGAEERRRRLVDRRLDALLELERPADAVEAGLPELHADPAREALVGRVMTALHRAGRGAEAVETYRTFHRHLREEYADSPGSELRALLERVLAGPYRPASRPGPVMIGRDDLRLRLVAALRSGGGRLVVVEGEAGIGKTVLLRAVAAAAEQEGARTGSGAWDAGGTPMAAWHEAADDLGVVVPDAAPGPALHARLAGLAATSPVLLALDDAHRADSASLGVLATLARLGVPDAVVVLVAARAPDTLAHPEWETAVAELSASPHVERLTLTGLDRGAVVSWASSRLTRVDATARDRLADLLWRRAAGHPLHTGALLDVIAAQPDEARAADAAGQVPERLRAVLAHRVAGLPGPVRRAVEALAVLQPVALSDLAATLGRRALEVADDLRVALDAGVLVTADDGFAVRHDLVADAARETVPAVVRAHLHDALLSLLADREVDAFTRLRHVEGAGALRPAGDLALARLRAGVEAYRRRALSEGLGLLERAAGGLAEEYELERVAHHGLCLSALGRRDAADEVLDEAVDRGVDVVLDGGSGDGPSAPGPAGRLAALAALGDEWLGAVSAGDPRRLARLQRVEKLTLDAPERFEVLAAVIREESLRGTARPDLMVDIAAAARELDDDPAVAARVRALETRSMLEATVPVLDRLAVAEDAFALAHATGDPYLALDATEQLITACLGAGRVVRVRELRGVMARDAERWHRPRLIWAAELLEAALLLAEGRVAEAEETALRGMGRGEEVGMADAVRAYGLHTVVRHLLAGTLAEVGDLVARGAAEVAVVPAWWAAAALVDAVTGRRETATGHLAEFRRRRAANTGRSFDRSGLCFAAAAAFRLGDAETARLVRADLPADPDATVHVGFGAVVLGPVTLYTGLTAWTLGDLPAARAELGLARDLARSLGWAPWAEAAAGLCDAVSAPPEDDRTLPLGLGAPPV